MQCPEKCITHTQKRVSITFYYQSVDSNYRPTESSKQLWSNCLTNRKVWHKFVFRPIVTPSQRMVECNIWKRKHADLVAKSCKGIQIQTTSGQFIYSVWGHANKEDRAINSLLNQAITPTKQTLNSASYTQCEMKWSTRESLDWLTTLTIKTHRNNPGKTWQFTLTAFFIYCTQLFPTLKDAPSQKKDKFTIRELSHS